MNIHIVQHDIVSNNPEENLKWILEELDTPESKDALLTVFPACTLCGAPLYGSVAYTDIQKRAQAAWSAVSFTARSTLERVVAS